MTRGVLYSLAVCLRASRFAWAIALVLLIAHPAHGQTQHLLSAGDSWKPIIEKLSPGDEIILLPGVHQPVQIASARGEKDQPITIRSASPDDKAIISGGGVGMKLIDPQHVIVRDIVFDQCEHAGLIAEHKRTKATTRPLVSMLELRNLEFVKTGRADSHHAVLIDGLRYVTISGGSFTGWRGVGVETIACADVTIADCSFTGEVEEAPVHALRAAAGCTMLEILGCTFEHCGPEAAVVLGGASKDSAFITTPDPGPAPGAHVEAASRYEVSAVSLTQCVFIDQTCPVLLQHVDRAVLRSNSFVRPNRFVMAILTASDDERAAPSRYITIGQNLTTWESGVLTGLVRIDAAHRDASLVFESNLWWSDDALAVRHRMIPTIGQHAQPQVIHVDPMLDEAHQTKVVDAQQFGPQR